MIQRIPLKDLKPNTGQIKDVPKNPRFIKDAKYQKLKQSLIDDPKFTELNPILVYDNKTEFIVMGGNMRLKATQELKWPELTASIMPHGTPPEIIRARIIKHNADYGEDDMDILANEWSDFPLEDWGLDLPAQFGDEEVEEDEAPELSSEPPVSQLGVVYQLGRHKVMCGSATSIEDTAKLFGDNKCAIAFTSPPYNLGDASKLRAGLDQHKKLNREIYETYDDHKSQQEWKDLMDDYTRIALDYCDYSFINIQSLAGNRTALWEWLYDWRENYSDTAIWDKTHSAPAMAERVMNSQFEFVFILAKEKPTRAIRTAANWRGTVSNVFTMSPNSTKKEDGSTFHGAVFPIGLPAHFIQNFTQKADTIYDAFIGTGTTLIACEQIDRICYGIDIDPAYIDVCRKRYAKFINNNELPDNWAELTPAID